MNKRIKKKHRIISQGTKILIEDAIVISESAARSLLCSTSSEPIKSRAIINNADYEYPKIITGFELGDSPHDKICKMFRDAEAYWLKKAQEENK